MPLTGQPIYELHQHKNRAIIPKIVVLLVLGLVFYIGVLLNLSLLELRAAEESGAKIVTLILLMIITAAGIIFAAHHAHVPFTFYQDRIVHNKDEIKYDEIVNTAPKQDFLDKIFHTYSVNLGNHFHLRHISNDIQIQQYLRQLIDYAKKTKNNNF